MGGSNLMSAIAGRVLLIPKGNYDSATTYTMLDMVVYNGSSYICKQECTGVVPTNTTYWMLNASGSAVAYINDIGDVVITNVSNGQVLMYDSTTQKWVNGTITTTLAGLTDTQIASLQNGQVLKYNATSQKWENAEDTGGLLPHLIIITETGESVVKAVKGQTEIIATETSTGHYECDVPEFGTWTIHAVLNGEDATVNLVVDTVKVYTVDDSHFHADITVTYPSGGTCSCSKTGETTMYATGSPYTFTVHSSGTWTITCTVDGKTYTQTVSISTSGQTESLTLPIGSTVTPTDDVTTLLHCAGIGDSSITTLDGLLADSTTLLAVINSHNAIDYLVRSTSFASNEGLVPTMTSNTTPSGVASCSPDNNSEAWIVFDNDDSTYVHVLHDTTTNQSNYIQYSFASACMVKMIKISSTTSSNFTAQNITVKVQGSNDGTDFIDIATFENYNLGHSEKTLSFENNNSYSTYRLYFSGATHSEGSYYFTYIYSVQFYASYYSQAIPENSTAMTYIGVNNYASNTLLADSVWLDGICNSTYFESVLNIKVPTMTSNTTPSGVASANATLSPNQPYYAFDKDNSTVWLSTTGTTNNYIRYQFLSNITPKKVVIVFKCNINGASYIVKIQGSNDGINFEEIGSTTLNSDGTYNATTQNVILDNSTSYKYVELFISSSMLDAQSNNISIAELQFYGREDV